MKKFYRNFQVFKEEGHSKCAVRRALEDSTLVRQMETDTSKGEKVAPTNWREVVKVSGLKEGDTIALYLVGSRLYGSHHPHSDYDFLLVTPTLDTSFNYIRTESENVDVGTFPSLSILNNAKVYTMRSTGISCSMRNMNLL
jgi:hypothetical protein